MVIKPSILPFVLFVNHSADIVLIFQKHVLIVLIHCYCLKIRQLTSLVFQNVLNITILIEQQMILALFVIYRVKIALLYQQNVLLVILELIFITFNALILVLLSIMGMILHLHVSNAINIVIHVQFLQPTAVSVIPQVLGFRISNFPTPAQQTVVMDSSLTPTTISDPTYVCLVITNVSLVPSTPLTVSHVTPRTTCLTMLVDRHVLFLSTSLTMPHGNVCLVQLIV